MDPNDVEVHLRGASDAIMLLLSQVSQLESHKRGIVPGSPRFIELAHSVREASQALADFAREEEKWAQQAPLDDKTAPTISRSHSAPALADILNRWRAVERRLAAAEPGSPEAAALFDEFERVRAEYMATFRDRSQGQRQGGA